MASNKPPAEVKAIFAALQDKEKLVKPAKSAPIGKMKLATSKIAKPKIATAPPAPSFGRRRYYGQKWD